MTIQEIKQFMKKNNITQIELAEKSGVPLQTLRGIFSGRTLNPRLDTILAIGRALRVDVSLTDEEIAAGASLTRKESITPKEDELLYRFRKLSPESQDAVLVIVQTLIDQKGK